MEEEDYMTEKKAIENNAKYKILVNYLKDLIQEEEGYVKIVTKGDIKKILKALEEVE